MHNALQRRRDAAIDLGQFWRILLQNRCHRVCCCIPLEGTGAAQHFKKDCTESEDVRTMINRKAAYLLRRHVACGAQNLPCLSQGSGCGRECLPTAVRLRVAWRNLGQTEVQNLHSSIFSDEDVFRFQIVVDDASIVGRCQSVRDLRRKFRGLLGGQGSV